MPELVPFGSVKIVRNSEFSRGPWDAFTSKHDGKLGGPTTVRFKQSTHSSSTCM